MNAIELIVLRGQGNLHLEVHGDSREASWIASAIATRTGYSVVQNPGSQNEAKLAYTPDGNCTVIP